MSRPACPDPCNLIAEAPVPTPPSPGWAGLPDELVFAIFSELDDESDVWSMQRVSRQWRRVGQDDRLWRREAPPADWRFGGWAIRPPVYAKPVASPFTSFSSLGASLRKLVCLALGRKPRQLVHLPEHELEPGRAACPKPPRQRCQAWLSQLTRTQRASVFDAYALRSWKVAEFAREHRHNADVSWAIVSCWGEAIRWTAFQDDPDLCRLAIKKAGFAIEHMGTAQRGSHDSARIAIANHPPAIRFLAPALRHDLDLATLAIAGDPDVLRFLPKELQTHPDILTLHASTAPVRTHWYGRDLRCRRDNIQAVPLPRHILGPSGHGCRPTLAWP